MVGEIGGTGEGEVKRIIYSPSGLRWDQRAPSEPLQSGGKSVCRKLSSALVCTFAGPHVIYIDNDSQSASGLQTK